MPQDYIWQIYERNKAWHWGLIGDARVHGQRIAGYSIGRKIQRAPVAETVIRREEQAIEALHARDHRGKRPDGATKGDPELDVGDRGNSKLASSSGTTAVTDLDTDDRTKQYCPGQLEDHIQYVRSVVDIVDRLYAEFGTLSCVSTCLLRAW